MYAIFMSYNMFFAKKSYALIFFKSLAAFFKGYK